MSVRALQRPFLRQVSEALAANPFGERRAALDRHLAGDTGSGRGDEVERALHRIDAQLEGLGPEPLSGLGAEDRALVEDAILFREFHRCAPAIDEHIEAQLADPSEVLEAMFSRDVAQRLGAAGFDPPRCARLVALFFQLRRAWWFIGRGLVGEAPCMRALRASLWDSVFTYDIRRYERWLVPAMEDFSTILLGETGTGKGAAAAALGRSGFIAWDRTRGQFTQSFTGLFSALNLRAFPESLVESELFGHRKGAFTGAIEHRDGVFGRCPPHGTIFLDEIGEVGPHLQIKLLSVLQERSFTPLGAKAPQRFTGRVLAATHRDLDALRRTGAFRDDFYYRLCAAVITMPSLRRRISEDPGELGRLVAVLVERILGAPQSALAEEITERITEQRGLDDPWPGNVRELEQCIRHVLLTDRVSPRSVVRHPVPPGTDVETVEPIDASTLLSRHCAALYEVYGTYEEVGRITGLDRRTVKKYITRGHRR